MAGGPGQLLERSVELTCIEQAVAALRHGQGGLLVVQGAAGIGKSSLLRVVCERAAEQQMQTLTARASELERDFSFGVVRQLLEARVIRAAGSERSELLSGAAALAGPVLGLGGGGGDSFAALHGLYWLLANLTIGRPSVLAIDDLHWVDEPSLRWLMYLCHRLDDLPVLVAATTRPPRPGHPRLVGELLAVGGVQILYPGPLSHAAVARLINDGLGAPPDPAFVAACATLSAGNPFALHELILDLGADGVAPVAEQAAGLAERVPGQVERSVLARLGRLDAAAVRIAHAVAVLGESSGLRQVAALAGLDIDCAAAAGDALVAAELLDGGRPMRFAHPLVRSAIYEQLAPGQRGQAHARAARLLADAGAEPEQVAGQLLACEPSGDADAVSALFAAAAAALARGAPGTAVTYLRRALAEPPLDEDRAALLGELGGAERIARDPAALVHLEQAYQAATDPVARAQFAELLADVLFYAGDVARCSAVLEAGLAELGDRDPALEVRLRSDKAAAQVHSPDPPTREQICELADRGVPASRAMQLILASLLAARGEDCHLVTGLVDRGLDDGRFLAQETSEALPAMMAFHALVFVDELESAQTLSETMLADAQARGSALGFVAASAGRGMVALRRGMLAEAEADTRAAFELATEHNLAFAIPFIVAYLGRTLVERGATEQAAQLVEGVALVPALGELPAGPSLFETRGYLNLVRERRPQAIADLRHCGRSAERLRLRNPNVFSWRSALALALAPECLPEARALAQAELDLARRAGPPRAIGIALRACGLLAETRNRIALLEQSVAVLETSPAQLELAYSLTELGAALRRAGARTAAREPLRRALDLAARCGATPLTERVHQEALAAGARPRRPWTRGVDALTPGELRVARLAAKAMGNRDIAQALFITTKTVSDHLSSAYRKLNISSRDQLAAVMGAHQG